VSIEHAKSLLADAQAIVDGAKAAGRPMTAAERQKAERLLDESNRHKDTAQLTARIDAMNFSFMAPQATRGLGDVLLAAGLAQGPDGTTTGRLDVKASRRVEIPAFPIFGVKAPTIPAVSDLSPKPPDSIEPLGRDERFMYSAMPSVDLGTDLSIRDFRETVRTPAGTIEREPTAVTGKATLAVTVTAVNTPVKQEAIILDAIPNAVLESVASFREFANAELRFQIAKALDLHVYTAVNTGATFGTTGATLVDKLRNAITAVQADGFTPDLAVLNPTDAAALDLTADAGGYVFPLRTTGTSSPLWGLRIVVRVGTGTEPPLVVDTSRIGALYMGAMRIDLDPFAGVSGSNFENNTSDLRCEVNVLMHVRSAKAARRVAAT
jgi:Phage capsid family